jgi:hypothetical protein
MTDLPKRRRGRPTKEEAAAREAPAKAAAEKEAKAASLEEFLSRPVGPRKTKLQPDEDRLRAPAEIARLFGTRKRLPQSSRVKH